MIRRAIHRILCAYCGRPVNDGGLYHTACVLQRK